jgi:hypothetical protein
MKVTSVPGMGVGGVEENIRTSLNSAIHGDENSVSGFRRFTPGITTIAQKLGWASGKVWTLCQRDIFVLTETEP